MAPTPAYRAGAAPAPPAVDLRSDTVTRPTAEMRRAMAEAEVGDDGFGDDPTVARLEARFAELTGKEAAVFTPSGTMANQIALRALAAPGSLVVAGRRQHVVTHEAGAVGLNQAAQLHLVPDDDGTIDPGEVAHLVEAAEHMWPAPSLVCAEDTHLASGGRPWPLDRLRSLGAVGVPVHLDGARIFNAAVATGTSVAERCAPATTVMACLSKGLGAPVGSLLAGPAEVIARARVERKRMGGTMRQVGVLAAAGLVALDTMVDRLAEDHRRARRLAEAVAERWPDAGCDPAEVHTNVVLFRHPDPAKLLAALAERGVGAVTLGPRTVRFVTHAGIDDAALEVALRAIEESP
ncbi:MAG TPA: GntG family PLP-dependent aldolase [Acidimicrobiales bacterium]|jgi:threonine aldolase|nr:GntG family PLP-dependent aldolase [Acidimicrobiales bacterium]